ncbi:MAG: S-layer homology domain-containing protein [Syntrophomonadaceae bacterium]|nr:S-layer homology domain-containing protein [Syntrophomonadaceae bacterium]
MRIRSTDRALLGNIALVIFLAMLATLTLGLTPTAQAFNAPDGLKSQDLTPAKSTDSEWLVVQDQDENPNDWQHGSAKLVTNSGKTSVSFTVQICTDEDFSTLYFWVDGVGKLGETVSKATYKNVAGRSVYQFDYVWNYALSVDGDPDYILRVYGGDNPYPSVDLDLEEPYGGGGGGGGGAPAQQPQVPQSTGNHPLGNVTTAGGIGTLVVDEQVLAGLVAAGGTAAVVFDIPATAGSQGVVLVGTDSLASLLQAGRQAVFSAGGANLALGPGSLDLAAFKGQGAQLRVSLLQAAAAAVDNLRPCGNALHIGIEVYGADGLRKGRISQLNAAGSVTVPYLAQAAEGISPLLLGVYHSQTGSAPWQRLAGSQVNTTAHTVTAPARSFSAFAVMAYNGTFADIAGHWAQTDIRALVARGIVSGVTPVLFAPQQQVTRAQFATMLAKALALQVRPASGQRFSDVRPGSWYADAVESAAAIGLVNGRSDGTFAPEAVITRAELAVMVANALRVRNQAGGLSEAGMEAALASFSDRADIPAWAQPAVALASSKAIVRGRGAGVFAPLATATRAEAAVMIKNTLTTLGSF